MSQTLAKLDPLSAHPHPVQVHSILPNKIPNFFIVGAPKCGTTALNQYLAAHPDVFMARKEMHHFGGDLKFGPQFYRRDTAAYASEFRDGASRQCVGECSVWYLRSELAASEIKAFNPEARIIIMLREPTMMMYSMYHQFLCDGNEHLESFGQALEAVKDRRQGHQLSRQAYFPQGLDYYRTACYADQVKRYLDVFGRKQVKVILWDDFAERTGEVYRDVVKFLGLDPARIPEEMSFDIINGNQTVKSKFLRGVLQDPWLRSSAVQLRTWLPAPLFKLVQKAGLGLCSMNVRPAIRAPFEIRLKNNVRREMQGEVEALSALLGRDLSHWSRAEAGTEESGQR